MPAMINTPELRFQVDEARKFAVIDEVKAALPAVSSDHGPVHFTFSADSWARLHRDRTAHYAQLDIIGWFHTHPGLGVFYSSDDVVVHTAAFTLPWHVGLVVDPLGNHASYFGWQDGVSAIVGLGPASRPWPPGSCRGARMPYGVPIARWAPSDISCAPD